MAYKNPSIDPTKPANFDVPTGKPKKKKRENKQASGNRQSFSRPARASLVSCPRCLSVNCPRLSASCPRPSVNLPRPSVNCPRPSVNCPRPS
eukprot:648777-Pyramimonas_sp.AAC.1